VSDFAVYSADEVRQWLDFPGCIGVVRQAMSALSKDGRAQPLRQIATVREGRMFGLMPGLSVGEPGFGAKLISVFHDPAKGGRTAHRGIVALFEEETGSVVCVADAHEITRIRTACATAVATDALARADANSLAIFGCGTQAESHLKAVTLVREFSQIVVWGRSPQIAAEFAAQMAAETGLNIHAEANAETAAQADVICTVTGSPEPVLLRDWIQPGTHINAVGSSHAVPVEIDPYLVAASAYFVEYRPSALAAAAEFIRAKELGLIDDQHIRAEIGEVLNASTAGRSDDQQITMYKSLGHIVQDLASARYIHDRASATSRERKVVGPGA
jgi:ornithine cyclodeaminase